MSEKPPPSEVLIRKDGDATWIKAKDLPDWCDFSAELCERLREQRRKAKEQNSIGFDPELVSTSQLDCLTFMKIPFDQQKVLKWVRRGPDADYRDGLASAAVPA